MANYSDIKGFTVQTLSSDTAASVASTGSWASGGNLNEGVVGNAGFGTYTAAVSVGGTQPPITAQVEEYDGSSWTTVTSIPGTTSDSMGSCGPQTNGMVFGGQSGPGSNINSTFEYDATNWTAGGNLNTTRRDLSGAGTQTAGLAACGAIDPPFTAEAEQYNGASWTTVAEANTVARSRAGGGTSTSAMAYGGYVGPPTEYTANAETWNGSAWTEVSNINDVRGIMGGGGTSNTDQITFGGYGGSPESARFANTEFWNGTSWTELSDLSVARSTKHSLPSAPTANQLYAGGHTPPANYTTITEEWSTTPAPTFQKQVEGQLYFNSTTNSFKETITDMAGATWASGGALNSGRYTADGFGTQTASLLGGGHPSPNNALTELYNGSSWTEANDQNTTGKIYRGATGTVQTAGLYIGGEPTSTNVELWNGSNWTEIAEINTGTLKMGAAGSSTAALKFGGTDPKIANTEQWNGSAWTEVSDLNTAKREMGGAGSSTAALCMGGHTTAATDDVESWDGTSWTEITDMNTAKSNTTSGNGTMTQSLALCFSGGSYLANNEFWNGTSWTELADLSTARNQAAGSGSSAAALCTAGAPGGMTNTEEFTANLNNKTITAS